MDKFIHTTSGAYSFKEFLGSERNSGEYIFDPTTGSITCGDDIAGIFSCDHASPTPLPNIFETLGNAELECISVANSEIMTEIQDSANEGAYFVLPSQLNGAEYPSHLSTVHAIGEYIFDQTGGPRGQLAVHPGPGQFVIDNAAHHDNPHGINAIDKILEALSAYGFKLVNGYLGIPKVNHPHECLSLLRSHLHTLRVLTMHEVPACGLTPSKKSFSTATHRVGLVYASAVPVNSYLNRTSNREELAFQAEVAETVLVGQYFGALKMAAERCSSAKQKVFLMPLGGGVFNNDWESIAKSMALAVEMLTPEERSKLEIKALAWKGNPAELKNLCQSLRKLNKLEEE
jgi:hypothetical protein